MIYTVTFNPAIDYVVRMDRFNKGEVNRTQSEEIQFGGKGINVSTVLTNLGVKSCALGFLAGFTGKAIEDGLKKIGVETDFIHLGNGMTRINVKLKADCESEINGQGPEISQQALDRLFKKLDCLKPGDILVLAGSIPSSMPDDIYQQILKRLSDKNMTIAVDATKDLLLNVLEYHPFLIKPNHHELGEIFGVTLSEWSDVIPYAKKLQERGAKNVLVSMGGKGAVLIAENGKIIAGESSKGVVKNTVGAGDSMVAGFMAGWMQKRDYEHAFRMGLASGGASACSENLATRQEIETEYEKTAVHYL